jgi:glucose-6-phosphate 1-dehydrogenase
MATAPTDHDESRDDAMATGTVPAHRPTGRDGHPPQGPGGWVNPLRDPRDKRLPRIAGPCGLVIFGVTGDLSRKKLLPAIYDLANRGLLPPGFALTGFARRDWADQDFGQVVHDAVRRRARTPFRQNVWDRLVEGIRFVPGSFDDDDAFDRLEQTVVELDRSRGTGGNHAFYLSVPPGAFPVVLKQLARSGLSARTEEQWRRVVIEKPFGHDLASARELNAIVDDVFPENSVFRIDHYLGKETVQNILAMRFANQLFEPIWNSHYVDHVQITMAEDIGLGGRAGYYDGIGAARDVIQNHLLQLLAFTAMEEPTSFSSDELRAEKIKVLNATKLVGPLDDTTARGQYSGGWQGGELVRGLTEEEGFDPHSQTETYAAITCEVENRRWAGVPFYLRTGKRLGRRVTEIAVILTRAPHLPFDATMTEELGQNAFVIRVQPDEGVTMRFGSKVPGSQMEVRDVTMDFGYGTAFTEASPEAYERLILDVLLGEPSLFPVNEEVERSWRILDPVIEHWAAQDTQPDPYPAGSWGPESAERMLARTGRTWRRP